MNKVKKLFLVVVLVGGSLAVSSYTLLHNTAAKIVKVKGTVTFDVVNDTGHDFDYYLRGGQNSIDEGTTKKFEEEEGTEIYYYDSGQGQLWIKVSSDMDGKTYNLSDLTK